MTQRLIQLSIFPDHGANSRAPLAVSHLGWTKNGGQPMSADTNPNSASEGSGAVPSLARRVGMAAGRPADDAVYDGPGHRILRSHLRRTRAGADRCVSHHGFCPSR